MAATISANVSAVPVAGGTTPAAVTVPDTDQPSPLTPGPTGNSRSTTELVAGASGGQAGPRWCRLPVVPLVNWGGRPTGTLLGLEIHGNRLRGGRSVRGDDEPVATNALTHCVTGRLVLYPAVPGPAVVGNLHPTRWTGNGAEVPVSPVAVGLIIPAGSISGGQAVAHPPVQVTLPP